MYQPIQLQTKSPALRNSIIRSLVALVTLLLAGIGGVQSIHAIVSESSAAPNDTSWVPTGRLNTPRYNHTATLLPSGKVLAAGGVRPRGSSLASAELYDPAKPLNPATGFEAYWSNTNSARRYNTRRRCCSTAASIGAGASAELYDPATGSWSAPAASAPHAINTRRRCCSTAKSS